MKKAYWIAYYTEIKDDDRLKKYAVKAKEAVEKYNGRILARSANNITLDAREMVRVALAEFQDIETELQQIKNELKYPTIAVIGKAGVGKSTLINEIFGLNILSGSNLNAKSVAARYIEPESI